MKGEIHIKVFLFDEKIYLIKLNKITLYIDNEVFIFLGKKTDEKIKIKTDTDFMLKHKFKISCWDDCNDLSHIKFLIKYSSILSNFAIEEDFENVSIVGIEDIDDDIWHPQFYISMSDTDEKFFNIYSFGFDISTRMDFLRFDEHFIEFEASQNRNRINFR